MTRGTKAIGHDEPAEAGWKLEAAIVGIAHWPCLAAGQHEGKDTKCHCDALES